MTIFGVVVKHYKTSLLDWPIGGHPVVHPPWQVADLGVERSAHRHVDLLETAADAEERLATLDTGAHQRQHDGVAGAVEGAVRLGRLLAVFLGVHVGPPAGEQEAVAGFHQLLDRDEPRVRRDQQQKKRIKNCI